VVLESAVLNVKPGREADFEAAFAEAKGIISTTLCRLSNTTRRQMPPNNAQQRIKMCLSAARARRVGQIAPGTRVLAGPLAAERGH
jgi:hypothetical protein